MIIQINEIEKDYDFQFWDFYYRNNEWKVANIFKEGKCIASCCFDYDKTTTTVNTKINGQKYNPETDCIETDELLFVPYTIKFNHSNWKEELKEAMFKAAEMFEKENVLNKEKEEIIKLFEKTLNNCYWYEKENKTISLANEIGVLRGLAYAMETMGLCPHTMFFLHFIDVQQKLKDTEVNK